MQTAPQIQKQDHTGMILIAILGGILLAFGLGKLLSDLWPYFGPITRIALTVFGFLIAHTSGYFLSKLGNKAYTGTIFHLIGIFLLPLIFIVLFRETNSTISGAAQSLIMFTFGALAYIPVAFTRRSVFVLAGAWYGFFACLSLVSFIVGTNPVFDGYFDGYTWLVFALGLLFIGVHITRYVRPIPAFLINFVASLIVVVSGLMLSDAHRRDGDGFALWDIWFPVLMAALLYLGMRLRVFMQSVLMGIGLLGAVMILVGRYFDGIGLPIILSLLGVGLIIVAYFQVAKTKDKVAQADKM